MSPAGVEWKNGGLRLRTVSIWLSVITAALAVAFGLAAIRTTASYEQMRSATERYIDCQSAAAQMQQASDYLTEQVRTFTMTGMREYAENYFAELEQTRRRDQALERLGVYFAGTETYELLSAALRESNELVQWETYAMRLAIEAYGCRPEDFPEALQQEQLSAEDLALSPEQQAEAARSLVFDERYQGYKARISGNVDRCLELLKGETRQQQLESTDGLKRMLYLQQSLTALLVLLLFVMVLLVSLLLIRPLQRAIGHIEKREKLPVSGSTELRFLANTYNRMFEQSRANEDQLSYEATHDALTGLYNRSGFDKMLASCDQSDIAMILLDLDHFKEINDSFGHDAGDRALKKAARVLRESFRSEDHVCRIGGDEFAVIMQHGRGEMRALVEQKIKAAIARTAAGTEDTPGFTMSAGVAFGDRADPTGDIFKDADTALYRVKDSGRNGCAFYE